MAMNGFVKNVLSGDTVVLRGRPTNGPPPERTLSLGHVTAPRLQTKTTPEEPFAWDSREFLRKKLIGQEVKFTIQYKNQGGREFGQIVLGDENINHLMLSNGWVSLKESKGPQDEELVALEQSAKQSNLGMWNKSNSSKAVRKVTTIEEAGPYFEKNKGKQLSAIVERVRDGSTIQLTVLPNFEQITLVMSGIKCPIYRKDVPDQPDLIEPFAAEARYFTESRILNQEVKITLEGFSNKNLIGSVLLNKTNFAELIVKEGLAKVVDWSVTLVTGGPQGLREAEKIARQKQVKLYHGAPSQESTDKKEFVGKVSKIQNGETISVQLLNKEEKKITLASIRTLKPKDQNDEKAQFYQSEAKEFLRKNLIGKKVNVKIDYIKPAEGPYEEKVCATVTIGKMNIAEELVKSGLAGVVKHKQDDQNRASSYDQLRIAEEVAEKAKIGIFDPNEPQVPKIGDLSENQAKAKQFAPRLQRQGKIHAIVEHAFNGSRLKVFFPKELTRATLVLSGIYCGKVDKNDPSKSEPFAQEALDFTSDKCLQYDVDVEIEGSDKIGCLIGSLFLRNGQNLSVLLLEEGLATVHGGSAELSNYVNQYYAAETQAKSSKKNVWKTILQQQENYKKKEAEQETKVERFNAVLKSIRLDGNFTLQTQDNAMVECNLAGVKFPKEDDYQEEAVSLFKELAQDQPLVAEVVGRVEKVLQVVLYTSNISDVSRSVNATILSEGLSLLDKKNKKLQSLIQSLRPSQEYAKSKRIMMWRYGDISEDEDSSEFGANKKK